MVEQLPATIFFTFALAVQLSMGVVFLASAVPKLRKPSAFAKSVMDYQILPKGFASPFAIVLICTEAFLALAFLSGWLIDIALVLASVTLTVFVLAVGTNLSRGYKVSCGCFGSEDELISSRTLMRLLLLLTAIVVLGASRVIHNTDLSSTLSTISADGGVTYLLDVVFLSTFLILFCSWILILPDMVELIRRYRRI